MPYVIHAILIAVASFFTAAPAHSADPIRAYTSDVSSPLSRGPHYALPGFAHEYVMAVLEEAGLAVEIIYMPWRRAQSEVSGGSGHLLFGATRTPARENSFRWVARLITAERAFMTTDRRIDTLDVARHLNRIGARSVHARSLEAKGFDNLDPGVGNSSFEKLAKGRLDAVYTVTLRGRFVWTNELGYDIDDLVVGSPIEASDIWLAASPDFDLETLRRIHDASRRLVENGTYAQLHQRYFGDLEISGPADPDLLPSR